MKIHRIRVKFTDFRKINLLFRVKCIIIYINESKEVNILRYTTTQKCMQALTDYIVNEVTLKDVCKKHKISEHTFLQFRKSTEGMIMKEELLMKKKELDKEIMNSIIDSIDKRSNDHAKTA